MQPCWTAAPMAAEGPRKGDPSTRIVRYGLTTQPALSVRGSSRRIMFLRFRPAYISMINRRASSSAVIGPAVPGKKLKAHQRGRVPTRAAHRSLFAVPERCSQARVRYAAPNTGAPLPAPRRSGLITLRWAAPAGTLHGLAEQNKKRKGKKHISTPNSLTRSLHISSLPAPGRTEVRSASLAVCGVVRDGGHTSSRIQRAWGRVPKT